MTESDSDSTRYTTNTSSSIDLHTGDGSAISGDVVGQAKITSTASDKIIFTFRSRALFREMALTSATVFQCRSILPRRTHTNTVQVLRRSCSLAEVWLSARQRRKGNAHWAGVSVANCDGFDLHRLRQALLDYH